MFIAYSKRSVAGIICASKEPVAVCLDGPGPYGRCLVFSTAIAGRWGSEVAIWIVADAEEVASQSASRDPPAWPRVPKVESSRVDEQLIIFRICSILFALSGLVPGLDSGGTCEICVASLAVDEEHSVRGAACAAAGDRCRRSVAQTLLQRTSVLLDLARLAIKGALTILPPLAYTYVPARSWLREPPYQGPDTLLVNGKLSRGSGLLPTA